MDWRALILGILTKLWAEHKEELSEGIIDFLAAKAKESDNKIDDYAVEVLAKVLDVEIDKQPEPPEAA